MAIVSYAANFDYMLSLKRHRNKTLLWTQSYINIGMTVGYRYIRIGKNFKFSKSLKQSALLYHITFSEFITILVENF